MEIVQVNQLRPGDRFALKDWNKDPKNRIVYRMPELLSDPKAIKSAARRKTVDVICETGGGIKIRKDEYVFRLNR